MNSDKDETQSLSYECTDRIEACMIVTCNTIILCIRQNPLLAFVCHQIVLQITKEHLVPVIQLSRLVTLTK